MKKQFLLPLILVAITFITGCGKGNDIDANQITYTKPQLLAKSTWKFTVAYANGINVTSGLQACQKDNILLFVIGGNGSVDEGLTKCNSTDPQTSSFAWTLNSGETILTLDKTLFTSGSNTFTIVSLTDASLAISQTITVGGIPQEVIVNFEH